MNINHIFAYLHKHRDAVKDKAAAGFADQISTNEQSIQSNLNNGNGNGSRFNNLCTRFDTTQIATYSRDGAMNFIPPLSLPPTVSGFEYQSISNQPRYIHHIRI